VTINTSAITTSSIADIAPIDISELHEQSLVLRFCGEVDVASIA
jgi:hypothetical protein